MTRTSVSLLPTLCLSLLVGCSAPSSDSLSPRPPSDAPLIGTSSEDTQKATAGQQLTFEVEASDPHGSALSFSWSANVGTLGTPSSEDSSSHVTWTAPACAVAGISPVITATVTNVSELKTSQRFTVSGLPICASWSKVATPSSKHKNSQATLLADGRVLISGGSENPGDDDAEVYDPVTDHWSHAGPPGEKHTLGRTATLLLDGTVLVTGGSGNANPVIYDPATNTWHPTGTMITPRTSSHAAIRLPNGKVLVAGGYVGTPGSAGDTSFTITTSAELYDPATSTWSATGSLLERRVDHQMLLLPDGKVLLSGGISNQDNSQARTAELYDPATGTWSVTDTMHHHREYNTATQLLDGKVLFSGGVTDPLLPVSKDESYDPATGLWSESELPVENRFYAAATLLADGEVLVMGGNCVTTSCATLVSQYDPATGLWSSKAPMSFPRGAHTAVRLLTGQVLVVGGANNVPAELYTP